MLYQREITKVYFDTQEAADTINDWLFANQALEIKIVHASTIRFWLQEFGLERQIKRSNGGRRYISLAVIKQLKRIAYLLRARGYTIKGAKQELGLERIANPVAVALLGKTNPEK